MANLTGTWSAKVEGFKVTLVINQDGDNVTGTINVGGFPNKTGHFSGTVSGSDVSIQGDYDSHPLTFTGTVASSGNSITGNIKAKVGGAPINVKVTFDRQ